MNHWTEIHTAAAVARLGTISAAASVLNVHRATVTRHIDTLETALQGRLFQRHPRGFTPTELGEKLLRIADATDEQFNQLHRTAAGQSDTLEGQLTITAIGSMAPEIIPILRAFRLKHPNVATRFLSSDALLKLQYGEAHVAFRAGSKPSDPDNVVQHFKTAQMALYAHKNYVESYGLPNSPADYSNHAFIGPDQPRHGPSTQTWLTQNIPPKNFVFTSNQITAQIDAVVGGLGIGFVPTQKAMQNSDLIEIAPPRAEWQSEFWIVTHVDLHRSPKVKAFLDVLKTHMKASK